MDFINQAARGSAKTGEWSDADKIFWNALIDNFTEVKVLGVEIRRKLKHDNMKGAVLSDASRARNK